VRDNADYDSGYRLMQITAVCMCSAVRYDVVWHASCCGILHREAMLRISRSCCCSLRHFSSSTGSSQPRPAASRLQLAHHLCALERISANTCQIHQQNSLPVKNKYEFNPYSVFKCKKCLISEQL